jgi:hypothetical protein
MHYDWGAAAVQANPRCEGHCLTTLSSVPREDPEEQPSRFVRAAADAAVVLAGARLGGAGGAALAAALAPYAEEFLRRALGELKTDAQRRVAEMLESTAEASECDADELADRISDSERTRLLTATAMASAVNTAWPPKVRALGRALADGLIAEDEAEANVSDLVIPAMTDMERPHLSLLELLVRWVPYPAEGKLQRLMEHQEFPIHKTRSGFSAGDFTTSGWTIGQRKWTTYQIEQARPTLRPVLTSLIGTLQRHGLVQQFDDTPGVLARFSEMMRDETSRSGIRAGQRITPESLLPPTISEMDALGAASQPHWSPTELGEHVLRFYHLAADS